MEEEEKRLSEMKPAQAIFERARNSKTMKVKHSASASELGMVANRGAVSDMKTKLIREQNRKSRDLERELRELTDIDVNREVATKKKGDGVSVYTKGTCSNLKSAFEEQIMEKKMSTQTPELPTPMTRRKSQMRNRSANLPNMFQQQEKRNNDLEKQKHLGVTKESIPMDKKIFNNFLDKFEDERTREGAKEQCQRITFRQKEKKASWGKREEDRRQKVAEEEEMRYRIQLEKERRAEEEVLKRQWLEQEIMKREKEEAGVKKFDEEAAARKLQKLKEKKEKKKPVVSKKAVSHKDLAAASELPKIVPQTCSTMKEKIQASIAQKKTGGGSNTEAVMRQNKGIKVGKLSMNQFEQKTSEYKSVAKQVPITAVKGNALTEIKKRYTSLMSQNSTEEELSVTSKAKTLSHGKSAADCKQEKKTKDSMEESMIFDTLQIEMPAEKKDEKTSTLNIAKKKSKEEMQNYLLTKLLFDESGKVTTKSTVPKDSIDNLVIDDGTHVELDPEYVKEIEQYLSFIDKPKKKTKKQANKTVSKLKIVEVNNIRNKFENKRREIGLSFQSQRKTANDTPLLPTEKKVGMFKNLFESAKSNENDSSMGNRPRRQGKLLSNSLISKFDDPQAAEQMKLAKIEEREERKKMRLHKLEEDRKILEEEALEAERKQAEMLEAQRMEQLQREKNERMEEEQLRQEERQNIALEAALKEEKRKADIRQKNNEALQQNREKNEPALKKKKVLGRIQHMFDKKMDEEEDLMPQKQLTIGSIRDGAENLFSRDEGNKKKQFQDSSLAGVASVLYKMKNIFETQDLEQPITLSKGVEKRKSDNPAHLLFEIKEQLIANEIHSKPQERNTLETEWAWKKKDPQQLVRELDKAVPSSDIETKKIRREKKKQDEERQKSYINEINVVNDRLKTKDALKEHEDKMREYEKFMKDIQSYLEEPTYSPDEADFKDDIHSYIAKKKTHKKKIAPKPVAAISGSSLDEIKKMLRNQETIPAMRAQPDKVGSSSSIKTLQHNLFFQEDAAHRDDTEKAKQNIGRVKNFFDESEKKSVATPGKVTVKKRIIESPFGAAQEQPAVEIRKSSYEWQYKKKNIQELQKFLDANKNLIPERVSAIVVRIGENLCKKSELDLENDSDKINEYDILMAEVDAFLNAPDQSTRDIDFKEEVEKYLDLIEEPCKSALKSQTVPFKRQNAKAPPKKIKLINPEDTIYNDTGRRSSSPVRQQGTYVNDLKNRLLKHDFTESKQEIHVTSVGASTLKRTYEKLNAKEEIHLLGPRMLKLQTDIDDLTKDTGVKSLEQIRADKDNTQWKWKNKNHQELYNEMKASDQEVTEEMLDHQDKFYKAKEELSKFESLAKTQEEIDEIKKVRQQKEREFESFINEIKACVEGPSSYEVHGHNRNEFQSYLDLIDENDVKRKPSLYDKHPKKNGRDNTRQQAKVPKKIIDTTLFEQHLKDSENDKKDSETWAVGKVDTSFLEGKDEEECKQKIHVLNVGASTLKRTYEKLSAKEEIHLLGPRTLKLQADINEMTKDTGVKSLEQIRAEKENAKWKWKNKNHHELYEELKVYDQAVQEKMQDQQDKFNKTKDELNKREALAKTQEEMDQIKKVRQEKEKEFESFIEEIKACVEGPSQYEEDNFGRTDFQGYLDLIDENDFRRKPSLYDKPITNRSDNIKQRAKVPKKIIDTALFEQHLKDYENDKKDSEAWAVGKVDTSFLVEKDVEEVKKAFDDHTLSRKANAFLIRQKLEAFYSQDEDKKTTARSKVTRKLIDTSMFEQLAGTAEETLTTKAAINWKWKQKNIQDLQNFMNKNKELVSQEIAIKTAAISRQEKENTRDHVLKQVQENEEFLDGVVEYLNSNSSRRKEDEYEFKQTIQVYLDLIESDERGKVSEAKQSALRFSEGRQRVSNLKKTIIDKQLEAPRFSSSSSLAPIGKIDNLFEDEDQLNALQQTRQRLPAGDGRVCDTLKKKLATNLSGDDNAKQTSLLPAPRNKLVNINVSDVATDAVATKTVPKYQWSSGDQGWISKIFTKLYLNLML